jgi:hypothetical protein
LGDGRRTLAIVSLFKLAQAVGVEFVQLIADRPPEKQRYEAGCAGSWLETRKRGAGRHRAGEKLWAAARDDQLVGRS